jgi:RimJ/RimL family protein N-acetyltransferase
VWFALPAPPRVTTMDHEIELRPATQADLPILHWLTSDPAATGDLEWYGWQDPHSWRRRWEENGLLGEDVGTLVVALGDEVLGFVQWNKRRTGRFSFCWNVGSALIPDVRGQGHGTRALRILVRYLFSHTHMNRIEAGTEITNIAAQRVLEKAGFTREGVIRGVGFQGGRWHDGVLYSVLRSEVDLS